jgi:hypothetical protein
MSQSALQSLVSTELAQISDVRISISLVRETPVNGTQMATISGSYSRAIDVPFIEPIEYSITRQVTVPIVIN